MKMSEPWLHPERADARSTPAEESRVDSGPQPTVPQVNRAPEATMQHENSGQRMLGEQHAPGRQHAPGGQQTSDGQHTVPMQQHAASPSPHFESQPQYAESSPQYPQQPYPPAAQSSPPAAAPVTQKKSPMLGVLGLLMVVVSILAFMIAIGVSLSGLRNFEDALQELAASHSIGSVIMIVAVGLWLLGSLLSFIAVCARRGTVPGAISLVLVILPSWAVAASLVAAAVGSTVFINSL